MAAVMAAGGGSRGAGLAFRESVALVRGVAIRGM